LFQASRARAATAGSSIHRMGSVWHTRPTRSRPRQPRGCPVSAGRLR
jgi:hypothetical protein